VKNLTIGNKLALLGIMFMIPFAAVTYIMVSSINSEKVEFARLELLGTEYYTPLSALLKDLQNHNTLAAALLSGDASYADKLAAGRNDVEADIAKVDEVDSHLDSALHTSELWKALRGSVQELIDETPKLSAAESLDRHQKAIDATVFLISKVSDNSKLTLDPDIDSYYMMNIVMFQGPATCDFLAQARSLSCRMAATKIGTPEQYDEFSRLATLADFSEAGVVDSFSRATAFNKTLAPELSEQANASQQAVKDATTKIRNLIASRSPDAIDAKTDEAMGNNISLLFSFEDDATKSLDRLLRIRLAHWQSEVNYTLGAAALGLATVLIIGFFVVRDITIPIQRVVGIANQIAGGTGNYSVRATKRSDDEMGALIDAFNEMLKQIQERDAALEKRVSERTEEVVNSLSLVNATLESTTDGILVTDAEGNPTSFNGKFLEMWKIPGQSEELLKKEKRKSVTSPLSNDYARFLSRIKELLVDPEKESFDELQLRDGRLFEQYSKPQRVNNECVGRVWSFRDITERKRAEKEMEDMHQQLLDASRQAGMAEVATSVLHNVGNVLNSANVSCALVGDLIKKSKVENLSKVVEMLTLHEADIGVFLTNDPKGKQLPGYLRQLSQHFLGQQGTALQELDRLQENIDHIKEIVVMQQSYAKISGVVESLTITSLVEDALRLDLSSIQRDGIEVIRQFDNVAPMEVQKHKILQIFVNLIRNAKHACDESLKPDKQIVIRVTASTDRVKISVADNGVGIPAENLKRIFAHGFTTRKDGHGFGLHASALAAKEMGGSLTVESEGSNKGAAFTLDLPYVRTLTSSGNIRRLVEPSGVAQLQAFSS